MMPLPWFDHILSILPLLSLHVCSPQARAGVGSTVDVLKLFASYSSETSYTVWESLVSWAVISVVPIRGAFNGAHSSSN